MPSGTQRADHLFTAVFTDTPRKAHFRGSVDNVNAKQQILTIFAFEAEAFTFFFSRILCKVETESLSMTLYGKN